MSALDKLRGQIAIALEGAGYVVLTAAEAQALLESITEREAAPDQRVKAEAGTTGSAHPEGTTPQVAHPDDIAVDAFAAAMKSKLAEKRQQGYGGWQKLRECPPGKLAELLHANLSKGDPLDIGNFAMMLWHRHESCARPRITLPDFDRYYAGHGKGVVLTQPRPGKFEERPMIPTELAAREPAREIANRIYEFANYAGVCYIYLWQIIAAAMAKVRPLAAGPRFLLIGGGDGWQTKIVDAKELDEEFIKLHYWPPSDCPPDQRAAMLEALHDRDNWERNPPRYRAQYEDGYVEVIELDRVSGEQT